MLWMLSTASAGARSHDWKAPIILPRTFLPGSSLMYAYGSSSLLSFSCTVAIDDVLEDTKGKMNPTFVSIEPD